jgi:lipopolysaccharide transport system permease protein
MAISTRRLVITAHPPSLSDSIRELWEHRELAGFLVWRILKVRYRQTLLGVLWILVQPAVTTLVLSLVVGRFLGVSSDGVPYPLFVISGLVLWTYFTQGLTTAAASLVHNRELITKVYFPRAAIPLSAIMAPFVELAAGFVLLALMMVYFQARPTINVVLLPFFIMLVFIGTLGGALWLSAANVRYRDVGFALPFLIQLLLFLTPVAYPSSLVPDRWRPLYDLNPVAGAIDGVRWCLLGTPLSLTSVALSLAGAFALLASGYIYFHRAERSLAEVI